MIRRNPLDQIELGDVVAWALAREAWLPFTAVYDRAASAVHLEEQAAQHEPEAEP